MFYDDSLNGYWNELKVLSATDNTDGFVSCLQVMLPIARRSRDELRLLFYIAVTLPSEHYVLSLEEYASQGGVFETIEQERCSLYLAAVTQYINHHKRIELQYLAKDFLFYLRTLRADLCSVIASERHDRCE